MIDTGKRVYFGHLANAKSIRLSFQFFEICHQGVLLQVTRRLADILTSPKYIISYTYVLQNDSWLFEKMNSKFFRPQLIHLHTSFLTVKTLPLIMLNM